MRQKLNTTVLVRSLSNVFKDFHTQKIINKNQLKSGLELLNDLPKLGADKKSIRDKLRPLFQMSTTLRTTLDLKMTKAPRKDAACKTCGDHKEVREVYKSFFGDIVNVVPCPDCK